MTNQISGKRHGVGATKRRSAISVVARTAKIILSFFLALAISCSFSHAQRKLPSIPLVRDAEIEGLIKDYAAPIFKAAGLGNKSVDVFLVNRPEFNAFVTDRRMFINLGAIQTSQTPNEIIGVIAHETGHIVGGHLHRLRDRAEKAQILAVLGMLAGVGAAVAGGKAGPSVGQAILYGSHDGAQRAILSYQREEERTADRIAFNLLEKTRQSSRGLLSTFKRFARDLDFTGSVNPYKISHPLPRERIALMTKLAKSSPYYSKTNSAELQLRHDMARAKIAAYSENPDALRHLFGKTPNSTAARYGHAIAAYLSGSTSIALAKIDGLIKQYPKNPYLYEMKGEILLNSGKARAAMKPLKQAIKLDRFKSGIIRIKLGHAFLETGDKRLLDQAVKELKAGISHDPQTDNGYEYLARAYGLKGKNHLAIAATAEQDFILGRYKQARQHALRAQKKLKKGSSQWLRMQDIIKYKIMDDQY